MKLENEVSRNEFLFLILFNFEGLRIFRIEKNSECGGLAQLGERLPCTQEASGSIPLISTTKRAHSSGG